MTANESKPHTALAHDIYEYAGFKYTIERDEQGKAVGMRPLPGQHEAAMKGTHRRNALKMYLDDTGDFATVRAAIRNPRPRSSPCPSCDAALANHTQYPCATCAARQAPETIPTPTVWRSPKSRPAPGVGDVSPVPRRRNAESVGDVSPVPCPSCDEPTTVGAARCSACGALLSTP